MARMTKAELATRGMVEFSGDATRRVVAAAKGAAQAFSGRVTLVEVATREVEVKRGGTLVATQLTNLADEWRDIDLADMAPLRPGGRLVVERSATGLVLLECWCYSGSDAGRELEDTVYVAMSGDGLFAAAGGRRSVALRRLDETRKAMARHGIR